jgi:hypothetical protein
MRMSPSSPQLRTTIIRNLQHKDPEAVASDAAFLIVNQLFGYDEDVDKTDLWEQVSVQGGARHTPIERLCDTAFREGYWAST